MICLEPLHAIIILCIIVVLTTWYNYLTLSKILDNYKSVQNIEQQKKEIYDNNINELYERDKQVLYNDFKPPERRNPATNQILYTKQNTNQINIPSRGYPDEYQLLGNVFRNDTETIYELFGRQIYPGSSQYEYYVIGSDNKNFKVKIPIKIQGNKEIYDDQVVDIPGTNIDKGQFKVKLYNINTPRYIPIL
jgi:hypothetical protein